MKKALLSLLVLISLIGCTNTTKKKVSRYFKLNVENLSTKITGKEINLSWKIANFKRVKEVEIYLKLDSERRYRKIDTLKKTVHSYKYKNGIPLVEYNFKIVLVNRDDKKSKGKKISVYIRKKNVLVEKIRDYKVYIYLPDGYDVSDEKYPVAYFYDGDSIFDDKGWNGDKIINKLEADNKIKKIIAVGISGGSERFPDIEFVIKKIIPFIDSKYRTISNKYNRAIIGSSAGAGMSIRTAFAYPDKFYYVGSMSYHGVIDNLNFLRQNSKKDLKIWLDEGLKENNADYFYCGGRYALNILLNKGYKYEKDIVFYEDIEGKHDPISWGRRLKKQLIYFFGNEDKKIKKLKLEIGVLSGIGEYFKIVPMIQYNNGLEYSAIKNIQYSIVDGKKAEISKDGYFLFNGEKAITIKGKYKDVSSELTINYDSDIKTKEKGENLIIISKLLIREVKNGYKVIKNLNIRRMNSIDYISLKDLYKILKLKFVNLEYNINNGIIYFENNGIVEFEIDTKKSIIKNREKKVLNLGDYNLKIVSGEGKKYIPMIFIGDYFFNKKMKIYNTKVSNLLENDKLFRIINNEQFSDNYRAQTDKLKEFDFIYLKKLISEKIAEREKNKIKLKNINKEYLEKVKKANSSYELYDILNKYLKQVLPNSFFITYGNPYNVEKELSTKFRFKDGKVIFLVGDVVVNKIDKLKIYEIPEYKRIKDKNDLENINKYMKRINQIFKEKAKDWELDSSYSALEIDYEKKGKKGKFRLDYEMKDLKTSIDPKSDFFVMPDNSIVVIKD
ncbi:alpha/beta hydrolase [Haliovirga abyssi]|uniref:Protease Do-like PDZ domain-containing protein n=1 Tax=Haliovirga abyssi TaxID=2996794 RepID=A0AAU9DSL6_9FUSO|nr:alpha/beta hydrolase-fold protein [Haliovirga abyssi]BDU51628.1 hypothetical protein HLVA_21970 [Haliovirga abyssi]